jgi:hypothetical protein
MLERHRDALERLDAGESPAGVMRILRLRDFDRQAVQRGTEGDSRPDDAATRANPGDTRGRPQRAGRAGPMSANRSDEDSSAADLEPLMRARLRAFLAEHLPGVSEQLAQVEAVDSEMGARLFDRLVPELRDVVMATERDPAYGALRLAELKAGLDVVDATQRVRSIGARNHAGARDGADAGTGGADATARGEAHEQLRAAIAARFDARIRLREHELERLAQQITELHRQIQREREDRDTEIDRVYDAVLTQRWTRPGGRDGTRSGQESRGTTDRPAED